MVAQTQHGLIPAEQNHGIVRWGYATQAEFAAAVGFLAGDINKVAYVAETGIYHVLRNYDPVTWQALNATSGVASLVYDPAARTLTIYLADGTTVVGANVGIPHYNDAELRILNTSTGDYIQFAVEAGVASQFIAIPARVSQRLNNAVLFADSYAWQIGDLCRTVDNKIWAAKGTIAAGSPFTPSEWEEITNTNLLAYVDSQLSAQVTAWQADIQTGLAGNLNIAAVAPTVGDDETLDYQINSRWLDTVTGIEYLCTDASTGAAVWVPTSSSKNWIAANNGANFATAPSASGVDAIAIGNSAVATAGISIGSDAVSAGLGITIGDESSGNGNTHTIVGNSNNYSLAYNLSNVTVFGNNNSCNSNHRGLIAIGSNNQNLNWTTTAIGSSNQVGSSYGDSAVIGNDNNWRSAYSLVLGNKNVRATDSSGAKGAFIVGVSGPLGGRTFSALGSEVIHISTQSGSTAPTPSAGTGSVTMIPGISGSAQSGANSVTIGTAAQGNNHSNTILIGAVASASGSDQAIVGARVDLNLFTTHGGAASFGGRLLVNSLTRLSFSAKTAVRTANDTPVNQDINLVAGVLYEATVTVIANSALGTFRQKLTCTVKRTGTDTTLIYYDAGTAFNSGTSAVSCALVGGATSGNLRLQLTGELATNVDWSAFWEFNAMQTGE